MHLSRTATSFTRYSNTVRERAGVTTWDIGTATHRQEAVGPADVGEVDQDEAQAGGPEGQCPVCVRRLQHRTHVAGVQTGLQLALAQAGQAQQTHLLGLISQERG